MEDSLVTVAIHTYERAIILKGILESSGIEATLHNVNLIQPVVSAGVRIRIRESDLPAALKILETICFDEPQNGAGDKPPRIILVPIDFSDYTLQAAKLAFSSAKNLDASIVLLHSYYSPFYVGGYPIGDAIVYDDRNNESYKSLIQKNEAEMDKLMNVLRMEIANGTLPDIPIMAKYREGVPEEQILLYAKKHKPLMIIMGTQGNNATSHDLLGSVTAEVLDRSSVPVFAFPECTPFDRFEGIRNIGFITRFDQRDLVAFDTMMKLLTPFGYKVYFIHLSIDSNPWDEIQLAGIKEYLKRQYPALESSYVLMEGEHLIEHLNGFIEERKIDVLALASGKRNLFARLFNPSLAHRMIFHGDTPLLVLKS
jgi:nucleotide-binding universal stress UspA family protein